MIIRCKSFKKVLIGSIFALQLTVTCPLYTTLAVGPATDKTPEEASMPLNIDVDKDAKKVENGAAYQSIDDLERHYTNLTEKYWIDIYDKEEEFNRNEEKLQKINLYLKSDKITKEEKQVLQKQLNDIEVYNQKLKNYIIEMSEKLDQILDEKSEVLKKAKKDEEDEKTKEGPEKYYKNLIEKYYDDVENKEEEFKVNKEKLEKINSYLTYKNITEEEKQALQEELEIIKENNQKLIDHITKISKKLDRLLIEIQETAEEVRKTEESEHHKKAEESEKEYKTGKDVN